LKAETREKILNNKYGGGYNTVALCHEVFDESAITLEIWLDGRKPFNIILQGLRLVIVRKLFK
jgi:hypothetical protein